MRAMVMAAGAGTRLRPLTFEVPKPMVPIANRPVIEYTLENLKRHGITDVILNLHSHPGLIRKHFGNGERFGIRIEYSDEPKLLGTAGGVKNVEKFLRDGTFLVMSGDGMTDVNITHLLDFHRRRRSLATMALSAVDTRFDYGVTLTDATGRITKFVEKPRWGDVFSNQVNSGIYVFEPTIFKEIPAKKIYDFGHDVWPKLLAKKSRIFGYPMKDYWCDVGNLQEYRRAQRDALDGKAKIRFAGRQVRPGIWIEEAAQIHSSVKLEAPCLIGHQCRIGRDSSIGAYTVIGNRAQIGKNTTLKNCILWDDVRVENDVTLENCIIGHHARVRENITVYDGAVINISE